MNFLIINKLDNFVKVLNTFNRLVKRNNVVRRQKSIYLVYECINQNEQPEKSNINKYTTRTSTCGELTMDNVGQRVVLNGWLQFHRMDKFLVLRDAHGITQLIINDKAQDLKERVKSLNYESALQIKGTVLARPKDMINKKQKTGEIEVSIESLDLLNEAATLPFHIREYQKANEALRMQYRYLDLRFSEMQRNLRFRSNFSMDLREFLVKHCNFVDVETPTLFKATPGGAQEFVVPTRHKNRFYSLVQSPQQFKQMLMCGGIDRYFQIARCYRDETSRPDRQPEFTQLDIEMSYTTVEGVIELVEDMLQYAWPNDLLPISKKFARMRYDDVLENYGCDKPDVRFDNTIINCTELLNSMNVHGQNNDFYAGCIVFEEGNHNIKLNSKKEQLSKEHYPNTRMVQIKSTAREDFKLKIKKHLTDESIIDRLYVQLNLETTQNSMVFLVFGNRNYSLKRLGKLREECAEYLDNHGVHMYKPGMHFLWIVDFPLFSLDDDGQLSSEHHPFTSPHLDDVHLLESDPLKMRALSYDLVLNGDEVGGGSIRIHDPKLQQKVLEKLKIIGLDHIVEMLGFGCPPHGGIALGLDRLFANILNTPSIRDVIAFPKTVDGKDPLSGAPSVISEECKKMYHL